MKSAGAEQHIHRYTKYKLTKNTKLPKIQNHQKHKIIKNTKSPKIQKHTKYKIAKNTNSPKAQNHQKFKITKNTKSSKNKNLPLHLQVIRVPFQSHNAVFIFFQYSILNITIQRVSLVYLYLEALKGVYILLLRLCCITLKTKITDVH